MLDVLVSTVLSVAVIAQAMMPIHSSDILKDVAVIVNKAQESDGSISARSVKEQIESALQKKLIALPAMFEDKNKNVVLVRRLMIRSLENGKEDLVVIYSVHPDQDVKTMVIYTGKSA